MAEPKVTQVNAKAALIKKLVEVQKKLEPLTKSGENSFHKYKYTTAEDVLLPVQKACNEHGLFIMCNCIESKIEPGKATVTVQLTVYDADTGESLSATAPGYAEDWSYKTNQPSGDKAAFKALTGATKYAVRSFFCLPSEDDPERPGTNHTGTNRNVSGPSSPSPSDQLRKHIGIESKRLGWQVEQIRAAAQEYVGKSSSADMSVEELQQFLDKLKTLHPMLAATV